MASCIMSAKNIHILTPGPGNVTYTAETLCRYHGVKDPETGTLTWIIGAGPTCDCKHPSQWEAEGYLTERTR